MRKIQKKGMAIFLVMLMVLGGMTGVLGKAYATSGLVLWDFNILNVQTTADHRTVTVTTNVPLVVKAGVSVTDAVYVKRTDSNEFVSVAADSAVNTGSAVLTANNGQTVFTLNLDSPLIGTGNQIQIQGAYFESPVTPGSYSGNATTRTLDLQSPEYVGSTSNNGNNVNLYFNENISLNTSNQDTAAYLRSQMSIATDGINFVSLPQLMSVAQNSNLIWLNMGNDMKVILGTSTLIKIASGTLKDAAGNLNAEMTLHVTPPVIQSSAISNDNHTVTITFQEDVLANTVNLKSNIYLLKDGPNYNWNPLLSDDTVSIESGKLVIHFGLPLSGPNNQIYIERGTLKDSYGNVSFDSAVTAMIPANSGVVEPVDRTAPKFVESYIANHNQDIVFVFDENVQKNWVDESTLKASIYRYFPSLGWGYGIPDSINFALTFSENKLILHFAAPLVDYHYLQFPSGSIKDQSGNVLNKNVVYDFYPVQSLSLENGRFLNNGRWLNLFFNADLVDNTLDAGTSHLKEKITISTDQGATFSALGAQDVVSIQGDRVVVLFQEAKKNPTYVIHIDANALKDVHNNVWNTAINQVLAYNTPDLTGFFFSNAASEFVFEDDAAWRSKVRDVIVYDNWNETRRVLNVSDYTLTEGKLTVNQGVFQAGLDYEISIDADGYSSKWIDGTAFSSSELFYMTAPVLSTQGGLLATVNVLNSLNDDNSYYRNETYGTQSVVFVLMNGTTPVSIVASRLKLNTGVYSANFNVTDAATADYSVQVYVVSQFNNDATHVGLNLATVLPQAEFNLKVIEQQLRGER